MNPRSLRDLLVLLLLSVLPALGAGCAAARAEPRPTPEASATAGPGAPAESPRGSGGGFGGGSSYVAPPAAGDARRRAPVPRESPPSPGEELWVIQKAPHQDGDDAEAPGTGALVLPRDGRLVPLPLKHTDVKASITGYFATVDVTQQFHNPYEGKIEAVYVFPLPHDAAVNEFVMTIGERKIRGIIREREEAKQIYEQAKGQGYVASLLTQERPNVFTQRVANIEPGKRIDVNVKYFHTLSYSDGWYEWVFPMVVGPRFNPPGAKDGVGTAARGEPGRSGQPAEVQYLRPGERSGHDVALSIHLNAGVKVEEVRSDSHKCNVTRTDLADELFVQLHSADSIPNKDFVLRWKVAGEGIKSGLIVRRDEKTGGGYFALMLVPPADLTKLPRSPLEMVFTLDVSGSMSGRPIDQAKAAAGYALSQLGRDDTFNVIRFAGSTEALGERPLPATAQNVRRGLAFLQGSGAGGGTMMLDGMRRSLEGPVDQSRPRFVAFLTDGYIGNEAEVLGALQKSLAQSRVFGFGVGSATNRYLLEHMARLGRGAVAYVGWNDDPVKVMSAYFARISHPALTDLELDWGGAKVSEVFPQRTPDLFVGRPVILTGRFEGTPPTTVTVRGKVRGEAQAMEVREGAGEPGAAGAALPLAWARMKLADLGDRAALAPDGDLDGQARQLALEYGLMSAYTSFVAVDSLTRTAGDHGTTVATPVPVPEGVRYETTVRE